MSSRDSEVAAEVQPENDQLPADIKVNFEANDQDSGDEAPADAASPPEGGSKKKKRKKNKKKSATALPKSRGTGFEMYFADPPLTPAEAEEEQKLYNPERSFYERIEECIQRYRNRRRMEPSMLRLFDLYLFLGGVDTSQRQFGGGVDTTDMSTDEARQATTDVVIRRSGASLKYYSPGDENWDVGFTKVVAGYLSRHLLEATSQDYHEMEKGISVVENFLRYVLYHDVCPEYAEDVNEAIALCEKARKDLPLVITAYKQFPGEFNMAAKEVFVLHLEPCHDCYDENDPKAFRRPADFSADLVLSFALSASEHHQASYPGTAQEFVDNWDRTVKKEVTCMEVYSVHLPSKERRQAYKCLQTCKERTILSPTGHAIFIPCRIEDGYWKAPEPVCEDSIEEKGCKFLLDLKILLFLKPGMKIRMIKCESGLGFNFMERIDAVYVPWYTFLPQSLMRDFKDPCPDYRPARSIHDPVLEDDLFDDIDDGEDGEDVKDGKQDEDGKGGKGSKACEGN